MSPRLAWRRVFTKLRNSLLILFGCFLTRLLNFLNLAKDFVTLLPNGRESPSELPAELLVLSRLDLFVLLESEDLEELEDLVLRE